MKILTPEQIKRVEQATLRTQGITERDLIERAAQAAWDAMQAELYGAGPVYVLCGPGKNGADGLALSLHLLEAGKSPGIYILASEKYAEAFNTQMGRLYEKGIEVIWMRTEADFPPFTEEDIVVDALYGTGLSRKLTGLAEKLVEGVNEANAYIISLDLPSGIPAMGLAEPELWPHVKASSTYTFGVPKLALYMSDTGLAAGDFQILDIALDKEAIQEEESPFLIPDEGQMALLGPYDRSTFAHKGDFGHALLIGGQFGMAGCMVLAAQAALRAGCGLTSVAVPRACVNALQVAVPEAICVPDAADDRITSLPEILRRYTSIGIGPGMGTKPEAMAVLEALLAMPPARLVLDADAINILAAHKSMLAQVPPGTVLTPHPGEFDRLTTHNGTALGRLQAARELAEKHQLFIILKGGYTALCAPTGDVLFNQNGNPGMATGGTGDVLTGLLTGLLAYFDDVLDALVLGVYLHGLAGDLAAQRLGQQALTASALTRMLGKAWMHVEAMRHMPDLLSTAEEELPF
jgi:NAD(P)H-hydrate epimerase